MEFSEHKPIYLQIADYLCEKIAFGEWQAEERIPSVREFGAVIGVNPNTIARTYDYLQGLEVIYNKRGIGYFIAEHANEIILTNERENFITIELPNVFKKMDNLDITINQVVDYYNKFSKTE